MQYRRDIDGLRAIAVLSVILFHSGISAFAGGYIGVDIFFVISGYLITTLIYKEIKQGNFTYINFYKRRIARLLPALSITLLFVLIFGFIFYNNKSFDNLGKEVFFSSIGAANILFSQGINYFVNNEAYEPLLHLWSLGIEEQFYIALPIILLLTYRLSHKRIITILSTILVASFCLSIYSVEMGQTKGYFLIQYRAFELLIGVITALILYGSIKNEPNEKIKQFLSLLGFILILIPVFALDKQSNFPGFNALWPCIGTAIIIAFPNDGLITKLLSNSVFVFLGLISYPLYLFHLPIISYLHFFETNLTAIETFVLVISISTLLSFITYKYVETPTRKIVHERNGGKNYLITAGLLTIVLFLAIIGFGVAKTGGFEQRFEYLNPYALDLSQAHSTTFHQNFERGYKVEPTEHGQALFIGDSVLQQYVLPISMALKLEPNQIDTVTRGGCVLLKDVNFNDKFSDISCNNIRDTLYKSTKTYDYIFISQEWDSYGTSVINFPNVEDIFGRWVPFLDSTIEHFSTLSENIIILGGHLHVDGTMKIQPSIAIRKDTLMSNLKDIKVSNTLDLVHSVSLFSRYKLGKDIYVIHPYNIFCSEVCTTNNGTWSFFSDRQHISSAGTNYIVEQLENIFEAENLRIQSSPDN